MPPEGCQDVAPPGLSRVARGFLGKNEWFGWFWVPATGFMPGIALARAPFVRKKNNDCPLKKRTIGVVKKKFGTQISPQFLNKKF